MKNFISRIVAFVFPVFVFLVLVNYFGDAAHLFDDGYEQKMAEIIKDGKFVTNISNYDERIFQKKLINSLDYNPDIVVLGSSRTMLINNDYFPQKKLINNSVSGASIEDIIGIYQLNKEKGIVPEKIIIGIDPWLFNKNHGQDRWQSIGTFYHRFKGDDKAANNTIIKYKELLSFSYFQGSLRNLISVFRGK